MNTTVKDMIQITNQKSYSDSGKHTHLILLLMIYPT